MLIAIGFLPFATSLTQNREKSMMDTKTLEQFKELFTNIINQANLGEDSLLENLSLLKGGDIVDEAMGEREQQLALKLKGRQSFFIKKIQIALDKIERGAFGICEECGAEIGHHRLLARPTATQCIACKEEEESGEKHIPYKRRSHTHGQGFSHKNMSNIIQLRFNHDGDGRKREQYLKLN